MVFLEGVPGATDYTVNAYLGNSSTPTGNSPHALTEGAPGIFNTALNEPDGQYVLKFSRGNTVLAGFLRYEVIGGNEATIGAAQSAAESGATAIGEARTEIAGLTAPDNTAIAAAAAAATAAAASSATLEGRLSDARAAQLDGVAQTTDLDGIGTGGADLTVIASDAAIARKAAVNTVQINETLRTATILDDDNITPVVVFDLTPTATAAVGRVKRAT